MPRIATERDLDRELDDFASGFRRSARGNLWRMWDGRLTLSVFKDRHGRGYCWCAADPEGPVYSRAKYEDEKSAISALWQELEVRF